TVQQLIHHSIDTVLCVLQISIAVIQLAVSAARVINIIVTHINERKLTFVRSSVVSAPITAIPSLYSAIRGGARDLLFRGKKRFALGVHQNYPLETKSG
ncbi:MAG TPA: hypothetical protein PKZ32_14810, partial [Candidatus Melainabacteria bacterium]|nr:hypothetical protein [Candidatus Melainabacteria bacterium]